MSNIIEEWRPVKRCNNEIEVSSLGNLRRVVDHFINSDGRMRSLKLGPLKWHERGGAPGKRYLAYNSERFGVLYAHILVAEAFIADVPPGMDVCHRDGSRTNNIPSNLRIDTRAGNFADKRLHGTVTNGAGVLDVGKVREIKKLIIGKVTGEKIAAMFAVSPATISNIRNGKTWKGVTV